MPNALTDLERRVLDFLVEYLRRHTYQPSIREIGSRFQIKSTKTVSELLQSLADKGWIERNPSRSRGVHLLGVEMRPDAVTVPRLEATGARGECYEIDRKLAGGTGAFLVAANDSLGLDGVRNGDLLLAEPVTPAAIEEGDLIVLRADGGWVFGRSRGAAGVEVLTGAGPALVDPAGSGARLEGRITCVLRRLRDAGRSTAGSRPTPQATP